MNFIKYLFFASAMQILLIIITEICGFTIFLEVFYKNIVNRLCILTQQCQHFNFISMMFYFFCVVIFYSLLFYPFRNITKKNITTFRIWLGKSGKFS